MSPPPHFGRWFRKVREKLGITQSSLARALGLKSYISIRGIEQREDRSMRGTTVEALLDLLGYRSEEELDLAWRAGEFPDMTVVRRRLGEAQAVANMLAGGDEPAVQFDADLTQKLFHWLAAHPPRQRRELLRAVSRGDAAIIASSLVERVAEGEQREG